MDSKKETPSAAEAIARLKLRSVKAPHRVPIEARKTGESRRSRRQSACIQALIHSERLPQSLACVVRNLSATGARLEIVRGERRPFVTEERLPDLFTLGFKLERTLVDCEVVWRRGDVIGVRFRSLPRQAD